MKMDKGVLGVVSVALLLTGSVLAGARANGVSSNSMAGRVIAEKHEVSASDLKEKVAKNEGVIILDARKQLYGEIIKGAIHVPLNSVEAWAKDVDRKAVIIAYCACPHDETSQAAVHTLREMGFENSFSLIGGLNAARKAGLEVVTPTE